MTAKLEDWNRRPAPDMAASDGEEQDQRNSFRAAAEKKRNGCQWRMRGTKKVDVDRLEMEIKRLRVARCRSANGDTGCKKQMGDRWWRKGRA